MAGPKAPTPVYCLHERTGRGYVTLNGHQHMLPGPYGSEESRAAYDRLVAEWLSGGRTLAASAKGGGGPTVSMIALAFWKHAQGYYRKADGSQTTEIECVRQMSRVLRRFCGDTPATEFGPKRLKALREYMLAAREEKDPKTGQVVKRAGWCRTYTNRQVKRVQLMFRWAASKEMVPASVPAALGTVAGLRRGAARESEPVEPVADELVDATLPHLPPPVKAMVQLQRLTGARGGELFPLRTCDIDMTGDVWKYRPEHHKTAHHDHDRVIFFGPQAQEVLRPFLRTDLQAYLFQPREWAQWRYDKQKATLRDRKCRSHYTKDAYAVAIARACGRAFPPPARLARDRVEGRRANGRKHVRWETKAEWRKRLGDEGWKELEK